MGRIREGLGGDSVTGESPRFPPVWGRSGIWTRASPSFPTFLGQCFALALRLTDSGLMPRISPASAYVIHAFSMGGPYGRTYPPGNPPDGNSKLHSTYPRPPDRKSLGRGWVSAGCCRNVLITNNDSSECFDNKKPALSDGCFASTGPELRMFGDTQPKPQSATGHKNPMDRDKDMRVIRLNQAPYSRTPRKGVHVARY